MQRDAALIDDEPLKVIFGVRGCVGDAADLELVQMGVSPAHCRLNCVVQLDQRLALFDPDPPPYCGSDLREFDAEAVQLGSTGLCFGHDLRICL